MTDARAALVDAHGAWSSFASALAERRVRVRETPAAAHLLHQPHLRPASLADDVVVPPGDHARAMVRLLVMRQVLGSACLHHQAARSPLWRRVFRTLELQRVDATIARVFHGARADL